jgi:hypothetical protein
MHTLAAEAYLTGKQVLLEKTRPPFTLKKITGIHFCQRLSRLQGHSEAGRIRSIEII